MATKKATNPYQVLDEPNIIKEKKIDTTDIVEYAEVDKICRNGDGDQDFTIIKDTIEVSRINRQDYLDSQRDDVGILNIIKKVANTGDTSLYFERPVNGLKDGEILDTSNMPKDYEQLQKYYNESAKAFKSLSTEAQKLVLSGNYAKALQSMIKQPIEKAEKETTSDVK